MGERCPQQERPFIFITRLVEQPLLGAIGHLLVVIDLQVSLAQTRLDDGSQAHPGRRIGLSRLRPVCCPTEVCRVDVGRQSLLEPVQLLSAGEMHLARQAVSITGGAQLMRQGQGG